MRIFATKPQHTVYIFDNCSEDFIENEMDFDTVEVRGVDEIDKCLDWYAFRNDRIFLLEWNGVTAHVIPTPVFDEVYLVFDDVLVVEAHTKMRNFNYGREKIFVKNLDVDKEFGICETNMCIPMFPFWIEYNIDDGKVKLYVSSEEDAMQMRLMA